MGLSIGIVIYRCNIDSYLRTFKIKNYKIYLKQVFLALSDQRHGLTKLVLIVFFYFVENCLYYDAINDSNPADIDRFQSHTGKYDKCFDSK